MKAAGMATLVATLAGTAAWLLGVLRTLWPAHSMVATLILTIVIYAVVKRSWQPARAR